MTIVSPHLPQRANMDSELEAIMRKKRIEVDGEPELADEVPPHGHDDDAPPRTTHRTLSEFSATGDARIDGLRGRIKRYFSKVAKDHDKVAKHFHEIAQGQKPSSDKSLEGTGTAGEVAEAEKDESKKRKQAPENADLHNNSITISGHDITIKGRDILMVDPYGDTGNYTGQMVNDMPQGLGTMSYGSGKHYEGEWKEGRWHGMGIARFACGDTFEGHYDMDRRVGTGLYKWADGRVYEGDFDMDERHGWGIYRWSDGSEYRGEFFKGHRQGVGAYSFADGSVYVGNWKDGQFHNFGEMKWKDGRSYTGNWQNGQANGKGVGRRADGSILHDGLWRNDMPVNSEEE